MPDLAQSPNSSARYQWRRWGKRLAGAAGLTVAGAVALDLYSGLKYVVTGVAAGTSVATTAGQPVRIQVSPILRQRAFHGILFIGHTDYCLVYQVTLTNNNSSDSRRNVLQFNSKAGYLVKVTFPPIVRARVVGGGETADWTDLTHSKRLRSIAFEFDPPPVESEMHMTVMVLARNGFPSDSDLTVQLTSPSGLVSASGTPVTWAANRK